MSSSHGVPTTRTFKVIYVAITAVFLLAAVGFAAAGVWVLGVACIAMGGMMTAASTQMKTPGKNDINHRR